MNFKKLMLIILLILIIGGVIIGIYVLNQKITNEKNGISSPTTVTTTENTNTTTTDENLTIEGYETPEIDISSEDIITIDENVFMTMLNELYLNYADYEGRVIELIGFTYNDAYTNSLVVGREYYCCGIDSYIVGFECNFASTEEIIEYEDDHWVKIIGTIVLKEDNGTTYPTILINTIEDTEEGNKTVWF